MTTHQITLEILDPDQHTGDETRSELARRLQADVGAPVDERPPEDEPPHLQGGSPHDNEPAPY